MLTHILLSGLRLGPFQACLCLNSNIHSIDSKKYVSSLRPKMGSMNKICDFASFLHPVGVRADWEVCFGKYGKGRTSGGIVTYFGYFSSFSFIPLGLGCGLLKNRILLFVNSIPNLTKQKKF